MIDPRARIPWKSRREFHLPPRMLLETHENNAELIVQIPPLSNCPIDQRRVDGSCAGDVPRDGRGHVSLRAARTRLSRDRGVPSGGACLPAHAVDGLSQGRLGQRGSRFRKSRYHLIGTLAKRSSHESVNT